MFIKHHKNRKADPKCGLRSFKPYVDMAMGEALDVNVCGLCRQS